MADGYVAKSGSDPLGSNREIAGLLALIGRPLALTAGIGFLLEMLRMGGTVAIAAGLFLPAGFHTRIRSFVFHLLNPPLYFSGGSVRIRTEVSRIMSPAL